MLLVGPRAKYVTTAVLAIVGIAFTILTTNLVFNRIGMLETRVRSAVIVSATVESVFVALIDEETGVRGYVASGNKVFLDPFFPGQAEYIRYWMQPPRLNDPAVDPALIRFGNAADAVQPYFSAEIWLVAHGSRAAAIRNLPAGKRAFDALRKEHAAAAESLSGFISTARVTLSRTYGFSRYLVLAMGIILVIAAAGTTVISDRARWNAKLARHDSLTRLPNRRAFDQFLVAALAERRSEGRIAVLYVDLDGFKGVNDRLGHDIGDKVLVLSAERQRRIVRPQDFVARIGGDEFAIVMVQFDSCSDATKIAERITKELGEPFVIGGSTVRLGASIGIAIVPDDGLEMADIVRLADEDMYRVKRARREAENRDTQSAKVPVSVLDRT